MQLTNSQTKAIESQKTVLLMVHPDAKFSLWQPRNTDKLVLLATWEMTSPLGTIVHFSNSWRIGKRGKVTK